MGYLKRFLSVMIFFMIHMIKSQEVCLIENENTKICSIKPNNELNTNIDTDFTKIRIKVEYTYFNTEKISEEKLSKLKSLINETIFEFRKFLKVKHHIYKNMKEEISNIKDKCKLENFDAKLLDDFNENDIIIFAFYKNLGLETIAQAGPCFNDTNNRPIIGLLEINSEKDAFENSEKNKYVKRVLLHEITHILVFSPKLLYNLGMGFYEKKEDQNILYINSSKVMKIARKHFNCEFLRGLPLEDHGTKGSMNSHWEARYMLGDYMVSQVYLDATISDITLALFEDTGFYKVEYYTGGLFKFGKNKGCSFFSESCIENKKTKFPDEFCENNNEPKCSQSKTSRGYCYNMFYKEIKEKKFEFILDIFKAIYYAPADYCPVSRDSILIDEKLAFNCNFGKSDLHNDYGEIIGSNSFCFESSLLPYSSLQKEKYQPICYEVECNNKKKQIIVKIGNLIINCPTYGKTIIDPPGFKGTIKCPKYYEICDSDILCNDMFECLDKKSKTAEQSYYYNDEENIDINSKDQVFTVKNIDKGWIPCMTLTGSFVFNIEGDFSKEVNILDKVIIDLLTSEGKKVKSICTPFDKTKYLNSKLQCDIDICKYSLVDIDLYLPTSAPVAKGYKFNHWKKIIGEEPGKSNVISDVYCIPDIKNTFKIKNVENKGCLKEKVMFKIYGEWEDNNELNIPTFLSFDLVIGDNTDNIAECDLVDEEPIHFDCEYENNVIIINEQNFNGIFASYRITKYDEIIYTEKCQVEKNSESSESKKAQGEYINLLKIKNFWIVVLILLI